MITPYTNRTVRRSASTAFSAAALAIACLLASPETGAAQNAPPVDVARPLRAEVTDYNVYTGRFEAVEEVELRARVSGYLDKVSFEDGQIVKKGDLLFSIDQSTFTIAVDRAKANLRAAEAAETLAQTQFDRAEELVKRNVGTVADLDRTRAALADAAAQVQIATTELRQAELDFAFTEIRAPFDGRMSSRKVDPGNLVIGGTTSATLLSTIVSIDPIHFIFTASEADYLHYTRLYQNGSGTPSLSDPKPVSIRLMDEDEFVHQGVMDFIDNSLDPNSGTITGRATLPNPDGFLVPGIFGRLRLPASHPYEAKLLPDVAIMSDQARKIVMVVDEKGTVSARPVVLGALYRGMRIIKEGLSGDELVVVNGIMRARPGASVTPQTVELKFEEE